MPRVQWWSHVRRRSSRNRSRRTSCGNTAMHLLQSGVPFNVIALWLGHESTTTTHRYVEADCNEGEGARSPAGARHQDASVPDARYTHAVLADAVTMRRLHRPRSLVAIGAGAV